MGVSNGGCDDAHSNLEVDWNGDSVNYTCFNPTKPLIPNYGIQSKLHCDNVKNNYFPSKYSNGNLRSYQILSSQHN